MSAAIVEPGRWSRQRWLLLIVLVFTVHLGFIFTFGSRKTITPRPPDFAPTVRLTTGSDELLALNDPTLFALPHRRAFAGAVWLTTPDVKFQPFRWAEPPRFLPLSVEELGSTFMGFMRTNNPVPFELEASLAPELVVPAMPETEPTLPGHSTLSIVGDLAHRRLLNPPELKSWAAADLLTNSVVQVLVDKDGNVFSSTLLARSESEKADQFALEWARKAHFEPLRDSAGELTAGTLVFEWHTVPLTNATAVTP